MDNIGSHSMASSKGMCGLCPPPQGALSGTWVSCDTCVDMKLDQVALGRSKRLKAEDVGDGSGVGSLA